MSVGGGHDSRSALPQTALVVQAVKKDQEGDTAAALSLYCKALDYFVPALHCECQAGAAGRGQPQPQWLASRSSSPSRILWETRQWGNLELSALGDPRGVGVRQGSPRFRDLI